ncbi:hypothetical protein ACFQDE_13520 [Deinococcus caeni]|uniref:hypothetical protein n=1 Tax=Deinococcus caeni TaxID=569127 RepID=UPI00361EDAF2
MTRKNDSDYAPEGEVRDDGTTGELLQDKMTAESLLRGAADADGTNPNDQPGFNDGVLGGHDFEDRQGTPNNDGDSDLEGRASGERARTAAAAWTAAPPAPRPCPAPRSNHPCRNAPAGDLAGALLSGVSGCRCSGPDSRPRPAAPASASP